MVSPEPKHCHPPVKPADDSEGGPEDGRGEQERGGQWRGRRMTVVSRPADDSVGQVAQTLARKAGGRKWRKVRARERPTHRPVSSAAAPILPRDPRFRYGNLLRYSLATATIFNHIRSAVCLFCWRAAVKRSVRTATRSRLARYSVKTPFPTFQVRFRHAAAGRHPTSIRERISHE